MKSLNQFLDKLHDTQAKDERNRRLQGKNQPDKKLPTKAHSKDK